MGFSLNGGHQIDVNQLLRNSNGVGIVNSKGNGSSHGGRGGTSPTINGNGVRIPPESKKVAPVAALKKQPSVDLTKKMTWVTKSASPKQPVKKFLTMAEIEAEQMARVDGTR